jgi:hypothetical protein
MGAMVSGECCSDYLLKAHPGFASRTRHSRPRFFLWHDTQHATAPVLIRQTLSGDLSSGAESRCCSFASQQTTRPRPLSGCRLIALRVAPPKGGPWAGLLPAESKERSGGWVRRCHGPIRGEGRKTGVPNHRGVGSGTLGHPFRAETAHWWPPGSSPSPLGSKTPQPPPKPMPSGLGG